MGTKTIAPELLIILTICAAAKTAEWSFIWIKKIIYG